MILEFKVRRECTVCTGWPRAAQFNSVYASPAGRTSHTLEKSQTVTAEAFQHLTSIYGLALQWNERSKKPKHFSKPSCTFHFYGDCTLCHPWPTFGDALAARLSCGWKEYLLPQRNTFPIVCGFLRFSNVWFWEEVCDCQCTILSVSPSYNWTDTLSVDTAHVKHVGCVHLYCFYQVTFVAS